ncbi:uncharacterized protein NECHADRAFT_74846 [Fusarium vanettenii 77-13-4]|uniref:Uncharacterized protein n=1 Tax=Fusarium vanettenii (strain ATCC MYA-4622 / CBS 123669 / FGSC 9596 / NRRL 45880 / 77-13-4) TaxID=660122 RepID=C7YH48_FUSV7|nr:uncharacterized protein NECHADRAFT_74846 [Fusarium vanettenii 77-13-4]EEU47855.1 hypothetical protein NECHADRAFT_74846 [Fusarium vanettenii 77-13-4]
MVADDESNYSSNDENDPSFIAMQAQQRLFQLKRDRDERLGALVEDSATAMEELRSRVVAYQKERRSKQTRLIGKRADVCAASVMKIVEAVERRKEIEQRMETLVSKVNNTTREVEDMMKAGFRGREKDMKQAR